MKAPASVAALDDLGRVRLSKSFFMREFLYSEIASLHGMPNGVIPPRKQVFDHPAQCRGSVIVERNKALPHRLSCRNS